MSKAFTREDDIGEEPLLWRPPEPLPPGVKNYITADGAARLREDLHRLVEVDRPRLAAEGEDGRRELQMLDQRIAYIGQSLQTAVIVERPQAPDDVVRFGATVNVRDRAGNDTSYRLVGVDETDIDRGWVSWRSPIAKALLNKRRGDKVRIRLPGGEEELAIVDVTYE